MPAQIHAFRTNAWVLIASLENAPTEALLRTVRSNPVALRVYDTATDTILAYSLTAPRRVVDDRGFKEVLSFSPAVEPDPFSMQPSRTRVKDPHVYGRFAVNN